MLGEGQGIALIVHPCLVILSQEIYSNKGRRSIRPDSRFYGHNVPRALIPAMIIFRADLRPGNPGSSATWLCGNKYLALKFFKSFRHHDLLC